MSLNTGFSDFREKTMRQGEGELGLISLTLLISGQSKATDKMWILDSLTRHLNPSNSVMYKIDKEF